MKTCYICLSNVILPIISRNFKCYNKYSISCHSFQRICLKCHMDNPVLKCSFCKAEKESDEIEIDTLYIKDDNFSILSCPFCNEFKGSHIDLLKHINTKCILFCECGKIVRRKDEEKHYKTECKIFHWCMKCKNGVKKCKHKLCKFCHGYGHQEDECPERMIECKECGEEIKAKDIINHYVEHVDKVKKRMELSHEILRESKRKYQRLMKYLPELYELIYKEQILE